MKKILLPLLFFTLAFASYAENKLPSVEASYSLRNEYELPTLASVRLYPNPADEYFQITNGDEVKRVVIHNIVGKQVKSFEDVEDGQRLSIAELQTGLYLVRMWDKNNRVMTTLRLNKR